MLKEIKEINTNYSEKQKEILKRIKDGLNKDFLDKYFKKTYVKAVRPDYRYGWLSWLQLDFRDENLERMYPFIGLQIYLYQIHISDIGLGVSKNLEDINKQENIFPYDYNVNGNKYYLIAKNNKIEIDLDLKTGNLIKREFDDNGELVCNELQIWFCQLGIDHNGIDVCGLCNHYLYEFNKKMVLDKTKDFEIVKAYFEDLKNKSLVSNEIKLSSSVDETDFNNIMHEIKRMIGNYKLI